jgi:hypothetical protein
MTGRQVLAIAAVSAGLSVSSAAQPHAAPSRLDYVLTNYVHDMNRHPTVPADNMVTRVTIDLSRYKAVNDYVADIRAQPRPLIDSDRYAVIGLTGITGWEHGDKPCALKMSMKDLDANAVDTLVGATPFDGTRFLSCAGKTPGSAKSTPFLPEDEFITGVQVCQNFNALTESTWRLKGLRVKTRKILPDTPASERSHLGPAHIRDGYKRPRCAGSWDLYQWDECQANEIVVGLDIYWSPDPKGGPSSINTVLPVCSALLSKDKLHRDAGR